MKVHRLLAGLCVSLLFFSVESNAKPVYAHKSPTAHQNYVLSLERVNLKTGTLMWVLRHGVSSIAVTSLRDHKLKDYVNHIPRGSSITLIEAGLYSRQTLAGEEDLVKICKRRGIFFGGIIT